MIKTTDHYDRLPEPVKKTIYEKSGNCNSLPDTLKSGIEQLSGLNLSDVRVHYNSLKPTQLDLPSYTIGNDIHVAPGQEKHLAHEAWHVVQQQQGHVKPIVGVDGIVINDDPTLQREADIMGAKALVVATSN